MPESISIVFSVDAAKAPSRQAHSRQPKNCPVDSGRNTGRARFVTPSPASGGRMFSPRLLWRRGAGGEEAVGSWILYSSQWPLAATRARSELRKAGKQEGERKHVRTAPPFAFSCFLAFPRGTARRDEAVGSVPQVRGERKGLLPSRSLPSFVPNEGRGIGLRAVAAGRALQNAARSAWSAAHTAALEARHGSTRLIWSPAWPAEPKRRRPSSRLCGAFIYFQF